MSKKHLSLKPKHPEGTRSIWFYEEPGALHLYFDNPGVGNVKISVRTIRAYLKRLDKKP